MIPEPTEALMWNKIDGTISGEDEAKLESLLSQDAGAREHFAELVRFSELLGGVEDVEPPTALRQRIEGAIDFDRRAAARRESATPRTIFGWLPWGFDLRVATAAAVGIIVGVVGYHLAVVRPDPTRPIDETTAVGTIGQPQEGMTIDLEGIEGRIRFQEDGPFAISHIQLTSERQIDLSLEYGGRSIEFRAVGNTDNPLQDISISEHGIEAKSLGATEYIATFARDEDLPLRVQIVSEGELLFDEVIQPGRLR